MHRLSRCFLVCSTLIAVACSSCGGSDGSAHGGGGSAAGAAGRGEGGAAAASGGAGAAAGGAGSSGAAGSSGFAGAGGGAAGQAGASTGGAGGAAGSAAAGSGVGTGGSTVGGASGLSDCTADSFDTLVFDAASAKPGEGTAATVCGDKYVPASLAPFGELRKTADGRMWLCVNSAGIFAAEEISGHVDGDLERHVVLASICGHGLEPRNGARSNRFYAIISLGIQAQQRMYTCRGNDDGQRFSGSVGAGSAAYKDGMNACLSGSVVVPAKERPTELRFKLPDGFEADVTMTRWK